MQREVSSRRAVRHALRSRHVCVCGRPEAGPPLTREGLGVRPQGGPGAHAGAGPASSRPRVLASSSATPPESRAGFPAVRLPGGGLSCWVPHPRVGFTLAWLVPVKGPTLTPPSGKDVTSVPWWQPSAEAGRRIPRPGLAHTQRRGNGRVCGRRRLSARRDFVRLPPRLPPTPHRGAEVYGAQVIGNQLAVPGMVRASPTIPCREAVGSVFCSITARQPLSPWALLPARAGPPSAGAPIPGQPKTYRSKRCRSRPAGHGGGRWGRRTGSCSQPGKCAAADAGRLKERDFFQMLNYGAVLIERVRMPRSMPLLDQHQQVEAGFKPTIRIQCTFTLASVTSAAPRGTLLRAPA